MKKIKSFLLTVCWKTFGSFQINRDIKECLKLSDKEMPELIKDIESRNPIGKL